MKLKVFGKKLLRGASKRSPQIFAGLGISGFCTAIVLAVKETPKALTLIDENRNEEGNITKKEVVKSCWKCYIPAGLTAIGSAACIIASTSISAKRNAALTTAYAAAMTSAKEYKDKVIEVIGEEKEKEIRQKVNQDKLDRDPITQHDVVNARRSGDLCYDPWSGRYFHTTENELKSIINDLNHTMLLYDQISLNDFYDEIPELGRTKNGSDYGWEINHTGLIDLRLTTQIADNGRPCWVLGFANEPRYGI